ncbi:MAG: hypothetical protein WC196_03770 [Bacilli bacterium]
MNRSTYIGNSAEIEFVKLFNKKKTDKKYEFYLVRCNVTNVKDCYMVRVSSQQYSKLSKRVVMTRADTFLIYSTDKMINGILIENDFYLDEDILTNNKIKYESIVKSGISIKMTDSDSFQIIKLTPDSFNAIFGEYELGAGASVFCLRQNEISKNTAVFAGWKTSKKAIIKKYCNELPELILLNDDIDVSLEMGIYQKLKTFSNNKIKSMIDGNKRIQEIIFNGYYIYEEPYSATYFYKGNEIEKLDYIPFVVTTGSGRSHGDFTIVLKPQLNTI